jgi:beta-mannosidase
MGTDAALVCEIAYSGGTDRSWWFGSLPHEMKMPPAGLVVTGETRKEGEGSITVTSTNWARVVTLDAELDFSDNYFELLPGETRTITWKAETCHFEGKIKASCWNP